MLPMLHALIYFARKPGKCEVVIVCLAFALKQTKTDLGSIPGFLTTDVSFEIL